MTNDGLNALGYDAENRLLSSSENTYNYDRNNLRVSKVSGSTTTVYVFSGSKVIAEYANGTLSKEYIYSGSALLATIAGTTTTYHHPDHLSARVTTDTSGGVLGQQGHYPYGESWYSASTTTKWQFTSYERDAESGNDYAMARYHVNRLGRFSSPDPIAGSLGNPQSLNRYAYVRNDPINFTDPLGLFIGMGEGDGIPLGNPFAWWLVGQGGSGRRYRIVDPVGPLGGDPPGAGADLSKLIGPTKEPEKPCQDLQRANPAEFAFVETYYRDAQNIAGRLNTTAANILGLSGLESRFGTSPIAVNYNNYFGLTVGRAFPGTSGIYNSPNGNSYGIYPSPGFANSGNSFAAGFQGRRVAGTTNARDFARALTTPPFAFNSERGTFQSYVNTINSVQIYIDCIFGPY